MSTQLIKIVNGVIDKIEMKVVNARELHCFLESKQDFSTWIKKRIFDYGFVENADFIRFHKKMEANNATIIEYSLTLDMAKELSMVERTDKGRQARKYFIECEKELMQILLPNIISKEQQQLIQQAVNERSYRTGEKHQAIYHKLYDHFKITSYKNLSISKFGEAIKFLGGVGSQSRLSDEDLYDLARLYRDADRMRYQIELIVPALNGLGASCHGAFHSMACEYKTTLRYAKTVLERETAHISDKGLTNKWNNVLSVIRNKPKSRVINFAADIAYLE